MAERSMRDLGMVEQMIQTPAWAALRAAALEKVAKHEASVLRLLFRTRSPVDPAEIEYDRGFQQGVMYVLDGLPNSMRQEFLRRANDPEERG